MSTINGSSGDDSLTGTSGNDSIFGGAGNDTLIGGAGQDSLSGGDGDDRLVLSGAWGTDTVEGGAGRDTLDFSGAGAPVLVDYYATGGGNAASSGNSASFSGVEALFLSSHSDEVYAGSDTQGFSAEAGDGNDTIYGGTGADSLYGGTGADSFYGDAGNDQIAGGLGDDDLGGDVGDDTVWGDEGNDTLQGGAGVDSLFGGDGSDVLYGGDSEDTLYGDAGNDTLYGEAANDALFGDDGDDTLYGGDADDLIEGGDGNDLIEGGDGNDLTDGGAGHDWFNAGAGNDTLYGGDGDDGVSVGDTGDDLQYGGQGNDTLGGYSGNDTLHGDLGEDVLEGHDGADLAYGGEGHDYIAGFDVQDITNAQNRTLDPVVASDDGAADTLYGGGGDDTLMGGGGNDLLFGGDNTDIAVFSGPVSDYGFSRGPQGQLIVTDSVANRDGTDQLDGVEFVSFDGRVYRLVQGDDGSNTTLQGANDGTPNLIIAHGGSDWGGGHATSDMILGGAGEDTLEGGAGNDTLRGEEGNDLLLGGEGADSLQGGQGDDTLRGGAGADTLEGGTGNDRFAFETGFGGDTIRDFDLVDSDGDGRSNDQLDLSAYQVSDGQGTRPLRWSDITVSQNALGDAVLTLPGGETITLEGHAPQEIDSRAEARAAGLPCFAAGTPILTPEGPRPVEEIRARDLVLTRDGGAQPVLWAGSRGLGPRELDLRPDWRPIHFAPGAIGNQEPLRLSPQHGVAIRLPCGTEALVRARHLAQIGRPGVRVARGVRRITYHHLLLPRHAILLAAGAPVESFYPGPESLAMLGARARAQVMAALFDPPPPLQDRLPLRLCLGLYGPRALPLAAWHQMRLRASPA